MRRRSRLQGVQCLENGRHDGGHHTRPAELAVPSMESVRRRARLLPVARATGDLLILLGE